MGYIYFIKDWAGNRKFSGKTFKTEQDASNFLVENVGEDELQEFYVHSIMTSLPADATTEELNIWNSQVRIRKNLMFKQV
jgi:hypothetical protein